MMQPIFLLTIANCKNCAKLKTILEKVYPQYLKHIQIINRGQEDYIMEHKFRHLVDKYNIKQAPVLINDQTGTCLREVNHDKITSFLKENIFLPKEKL